MSVDAVAHLWRMLAIDSNFESSELPTDEKGRLDVLEQPLIGSGREDWNGFSWFIVTESSGPTYVSPDSSSPKDYAARLVTRSSIN
jgi:hypothetical protein